MPLVPTKMADAQCSISENHWPGGPRDMLTTTSARENSSPASWATYKKIFFYKYAVLKHIRALLRIFFVAATLSFWWNSFVAATSSLWPNSSVPATPCLADIHIQELWDVFPSLKNYRFLIIEKGHFNFTILFVV